MTDTKGKTIQKGPMASIGVLVTLDMRHWIASQEVNMSEYVRTLIAKDMERFDEEMGITDEAS